MFPTAIGQPLGSRWTAVGQLLGSCCAAIATQPLQHTLYNQEGLGLNLFSFS